MAIREVMLEDEEDLRKKCKDVKEINDKILTLLDDMAETMYEKQGVGLAAPQVGILRKVVVIDIGEGLIELINPVIIETRGEVTDNEGCLSVPGKCAKVKRPQYCKVEALDRNGEKITVEGEDLLARALTHELDHLDGILYTDIMIDGTFCDVESLEEEE